MKKDIYTVGYVGFRIEDFVAAIKRVGIDFVIDVRSVARSMYFAAFNEKNLSKVLATEGIAYRNLKDEFGARQEDEIYYTDGYLDFEKFAVSVAFMGGIKAVEELTDAGKSVCLMCAEKDPLNCHRAALCGKEFSHRGFEVLHIVPVKGDVVIERQSDLEKRLVGLYFKGGFCGGDLFGEDMCENLLEQSYKKHNKKIGFRPKK
ncbi:MAG: DUF488 domain-containing protein [Firmicutes bacterium]|nr:DUF488 domain-containing protein [Bacillota bacterium]